MKKVLLATTILAMSASVAAAEVTVGGDGRMGVIKGFKGSAAEHPKLAFTSRLRIKFSASGDNNNGVTFGGSVRADNAASGTSGLAGSVYLESGFGRIEMGDVDGAAAAAVGQVDGVGLTGLGDLNEGFYFANGGSSESTHTGRASGLTGDPSALFTYKFGDASVYASVTNPRFTLASGTETGVAYAVGAKYKTGSYGGGVGFEYLELKDIATGNKDKVTHIVAGVNADVSGIAVKVVGGYTMYTPSAGDKTQGMRGAASAAYTISDITVTGFGSYTQTKNKTTSDKEKVITAGLGLAYDLGGGAKLKAGVAGMQTTPPVGDKVKDYAADAGVSFDF